MSDGTPIFLLRKDEASPPVPTCEVMHYIFDMLIEFEGMAKHHRCDALAAMLALVAAEARREAKAHAMSP